MSGVISGRRGASGPMPGFPADRRLTGLRFLPVNQRQNLVHDSGTFFRPFGTRCGQIDG